MLAAVDGVVSTDTSNLEGHVVWLRDARWRRSLYYAHLHAWAVADGAPVKAGDVIGFIGKTGNARTTRRICTSAPTDEARPIRIRFCSSRIDPRRRSRQRWRCSSPGPNDTPGRAASS